MNNNNSSNDRGTKLRRREGELQVRAGSSYSSSGGLWKQVYQCIVHPNYNAYTEDWDVAVLKLESAFPIIPFVIQTIGLSFADPAPDSLAWLTGFGRIAKENPGLSSQLQGRVVRTVDGNICRSRLPGGDFRFFTDRKLCATSAACYVSIVILENL